MWDWLWFVGVSRRLKILNCCGFTQWIDLKYGSCSGGIVRIVFARECTLVFLMSGCPACILPMVKGVMKGVMTCGCTGWWGVDKEGGLSWGRLGCGDRWLLWMLDMCGRDEGRTSRGFRIRTFLYDGAIVHGPYLLYFLSACIEQAGGVGGGAGVKVGRAFGRGCRQGLYDRWWFYFPTYSPPIGLSSTLHNWSFLLPARSTPPPSAP